MRHSFHILWIFSFYLLSIPFEASATEDDQWSARVFYDRINSSIYVRPKDDSDSNSETETKYQTKTNWIVGTAFGRGKWVASFARPVAGTGDIKKYEKTDLKSYQLLYDSSQWSIEGYWHRFTGYSLEGALPTGDRAPYFPDMRATFYGINALYIKSPEHVWVPGRFGKEKNFDPGWDITLVAGVHIAATEVTGSHHLILEDDQDKYSGDWDIHGFDLVAAGPSIGTAFSWIGENIRLGASIALAFERYHCNAHGEGNYEETNSGIATPMRLGAAYALDPFEVGVYGLLDKTSFELRDSSYQLDRDAINTYFKVEF